MLVAATAAADPTPPQVHGFVSEGGFYSTDNDYIGHSSRGSLEFFQTAVNVSSELSDKLRAGLQLFSQDEGSTNDPTPRLDWAYLDYRWQDWLGIRAGRVRIPFGLYNDYIDIDAARVQILLPQSVYPISDRNTLTAQNGFSVYGTISLRCRGELDYQLYGGVLTFPLPATQDPTGTTIYKADSKYIIGGQLFWDTPIDELRVGVGGLRTVLDTYLVLSPAMTEQLIASGAVPADFDGKLLYSIDPANLWIASAEYTHDDLKLSAEYSRWIIHSKSTPVPLVPSPLTVSERFYARATYRLTETLSGALSYSVLFADAHDRGGDNMLMFPKDFYAWSRDASASIRYDVNDYWLWKAEAHFIDGVAALDPRIDPNPSRYWGLFLVRTTVTF